MLENIKIAPSNKYQIPIRAVRGIALLYQSLLYKLVFVEYLKHLSFEKNFYVCRLISVS